MEKHIDRIFCFGCSFTQFLWPCYPEILKKDLGIPVYNFGLPGFGNVGIFHRLVEMDLKYKFTDNDVIITQWSSWNREDRYMDEGWRPAGGLPCNTKYFYDDAFMRKYWSEKNDIVKSATAIITANKLYDCINFTMCEYPSLGEQKVEYYKMIPDRYNKSVIDELGFYYEHLPKAVDLYNDIKNSKFDDVNAHDTHPDPLAQLELVEKFIYPRLNKKIKESTRNDVLKVFLAIKDLIMRMHNNDGRVREIFDLWQQGNWPCTHDIKMYETIIKRFEKIHIPDMRYKLRW